MAYSSMATKNASILLREVKNRNPGDTNALDNHAINNRKQSIFSASAHNSPANIGLSSEYHKQIALLSYLHRQHLSNPRFLLPRKTMAAGS